MSIIDRLLEEQEERRRQRRLGDVPSYAAPDPMSGIEAPRVRPPVPLAPEIPQREPLPPGPTMRDDVGSSLNLSTQPSLGPAELSFEERLKAAQAKGNKKELYATIAAALPALLTGGKAQMSQTALQIARRRGQRPKTELMEQYKLRRASEADKGAKAAAARKAAQDASKEERAQKQDKRADAAETRAQGTYDAGREEANPQSELSRNLQARFVATMPPGIVERLGGQDGIRRLTAKELKAYGGKVFETDEGVRKAFAVHELKVREGLAGAGKLTRAPGAGAPVSRTGGPIDSPMGAMQRGLLEQFGSDPPQWAKEAVGQLANERNPKRRKEVIDRLERAAKIRHEDVDVRRKEYGLALNRTKLVTLRTNLKELEDAVADSKAKFGGEIKGQGMDAWLYSLGPEALRAWSQSPEGQRVERAKRGLLDSRVRPASGAVVGKDEQESFGDQLATRDFNTDKELEAAMAFTRKYINKELGVLKDAYGPDAIQSFETNRKTRLKKEGGEAKTVVSRELQEHSSGKKRVKVTYSDGTVEYEGG